MATWDEVRAAALRLPGVTEKGRQWRVPNGMLAWERPLRKADLEHLGASAPTCEILGIRTVDLDAKDELLVAFPAVFFTTPHFDGYPAVLARLPELDPSVLEQLLTDAWLDRAPKKLVRAWNADHA